MFLPFCEPAGHAQLASQFLLKLYKHSNDNAETQRETEMGQGEREKIQLDADGSYPSSSSSYHLCLCLCRICHEEEEIEANTMETPCGCSGTLKYAHRGCIQRWCEEKGSTDCEICLQKFKPGYNLPPKASQLIDAMVTIRGSLEVPRLKYESHTGGSHDDGEMGYDSPECYPSTGRGASFSQPIPLMVATVLLVWQLVILITGDDDYPFALTTVLLLRAGGILLPFYLIMQMISAIQRSYWQQQSRHLRNQPRVEAIGHEDEDVEILQHIV